MEEVFVKSPLNKKDNADQCLPTVLVTGFGLFRNYSENSSWITVKELLSLDITNYTLIVKELPVEYEVITNTVPELWKKYNPNLVVHCGMSEQAQCLTLEKFAHNEDYLACDVKGSVPPMNVCCKIGPQKMSTAIDIDKILEDVNSSATCVKAASSENAGRYLCEFIYYTSLKISRNTVFIHIPPLNRPYCQKSMAQTLDMIITSILKQMTL